MVRRRRQGTPPSGQDEQIWTAHEFRGEINRKSPANRQAEALLAVMAAADLHHAGEIFTN
jgi:hypothetical protein